jgi:hypothetical protein
MSSGVDCALYWMCVVTYTIFGHLRLILEVKKSVLFSNYPSKPSFLICHFVPTTRCFSETMRRTGQRGALPLYGTAAVAIVWTDQLPVGRVAVVAVCVGRQWQNCYYYYYYYYYLTAIGLTHGGSSIHLHTNSTQNTEDGTHTTITRKKLGSKLGSAGRAPCLRVIPWHLTCN